MAPPSLGHLLDEYFLSSYTHDQSVMSKTQQSDLFAERLRDLGPTLTPASRRVARFIAENRAVTLGSSALSLAARIGTSDATVV